MLSQAGLNVNETVLTGSKEEAVSISQKLGFPVVLKIVSSDIVHKSDAGGVLLNLMTPNEVRRGYDDMLVDIKKKFLQASIQGISVQKMAAPGVEIIIGMSKDAQFGPVLMFGLGGIFVEIFKDVSFRVVPVTKQDAHEMIKEIKGYALLTGYRKQNPVDIPFIEDMIVGVSYFIENNPRIKELDLNPVIAYNSGAVAVDARVITE